MLSSTKSKLVIIAVALCVVMAGYVLKLCWNVSDRGISSGHWKMCGQAEGRGDDAMLGDLGFVGAERLRDGVVYQDGQPRLEIVGRNIRFPPVADSTIEVRSVKTGQVYRYCRIKEVIKKKL